MTSNEAQPEHFQQSIIDKLGAFYNRMMLNFTRSDFAGFHKQLLSDLFVESGDILQIVVEMLQAYVTRDFTMVACKAYGLTTHIARTVMQLWWWYSEARRPSAVIADINRELSGVTLFHSADQLPDSSRFGCLRELESGSFGVDTMPCTDCLAKHVRSTALQTPALALAFPIFDEHPLAKVAHAKAPPGTAMFANDSIAPLARPKRWQLFHLSNWLPPPKGPIIAPPEHAQLYSLSVRSKCFDDYSTRPILRYQKHRQIRRRKHILRDVARSGYSTDMELQEFTHHNSDYNSIAPGILSPYTEGDDTDFSSDLYPTTEGHEHLTRSKSAMLGAP